MKQTAKKRQPSEVELVAMAMAWSQRHLLREPPTPKACWFDYNTKSSRAGYRCEARAFLSALRKP